MNRSPRRKISIYIAASVLATAHLSLPSRASASPALVRDASAIQTNAQPDDNPAKAYLAARAALKGPWQSFVAKNSPDIVIDDLAGETIEITGRIVGRATLPDGSLMLIFDTKGQSLNLTCSLDPDAFWLESGSTTRVLVSVPGATELATSHSMLPVVAAAAEFAVDDLEHPAVPPQPVVDPPKAQTPDRSADSDRRVPVTSRTASYQFRSLPIGQPIAPLSAKLMAVYPTYRAFIAGQNRNLSSKQVDTITTSVLYYSDLENLDPRLVIAMILAESNFDPWSTSRTGAMGLSQLMPGTAAGLGINDAYDPVQNIGAAVHILSAHVKKYGGAGPDGLVPLNTLFLTMAAYNAGSGAVKKYGGVPPYRETQNYVRKVAALYRKMCGL